MWLVSQRLNSGKLWRSLSLDNLVKPYTNPYFKPSFLLSQTIILVIGSSPAGFGVWFYIAMYLICPDEELVQPRILQDFSLHCAQEQNLVHRFCLRQLVRHRSVQICIHIPLMPVEEFLEKAHCTDCSFWSIFLCADYMRRREHITEVRPFIQLVPLCEALSVEKLQAAKTRYPVTVFDSYLRRALHHFQQECHLKLWWRKFSLGRRCIVIFGADNIYPLLLMHSILLARSILL